MKFIKIIIFIYLCKSMETFTFINKTTSYIYYRQWNASSNGTLSFKFKTYNKWGLLLYTDNSRNPNSIRNALLIKLRRSKLFVTVQMGDQDYKSKKYTEIGENLNNLQWHHVEIVRHGKETIITLDKKTTQYLNNDGEHESLELDSGLYVGGLSDGMLKSTSLVDRSVLAAPRFLGCIKDLVFSHSHAQQQIVQQPLVKKVQVRAGCLNACANENETCFNNGQCRNKFTKIDCDCKGTGYEGRRCTKVADSIQFNGNTFLTIDLAKKKVPSTIIKFRFKTTEGDGVIFAAQGGNDHLLLELSNNIIRWSIDLGGGPHISHLSDIPFNTGTWHLVEVIRKGRDTSIRVDKKFCVNTSTPGVHPLFNMRGLLYVGGHPNKKVLGQINSVSKRNFTGCLQQAYFNGMDIIYKVLQIRSSRFKKYGKWQRGCTVVKKKYVVSRENKEPSLTDSKDNHHNDVPEENNANDLKTTLVPREAERKKKRVGMSDSSSLSRQSIVWITVGLVIGSIILVITVGVIVHNVRYRYRAVLLSSSLKSLKENNNSLHRRFSSNDRILRGSSDRMLHGSSDRFMRSSTDRLIRGSTDRIMRNSTERMMRNSTDRLARGSVDRLARGSVDRLVRSSTDRLVRSSTDRLIRGSNDRMLRGSTDRSMRASTDRIMRASTDRISSRGDRSQRGSVHGSIHTISDRIPREKIERSTHITTELAMDSNTGRILNDINDNEILKDHKDSSSSPAPHPV